MRHTTDHHLNEHLVRHHRPRCDDFHLLRCHEDAAHACVWHRPIALSIGLATAAPLYTWPKQPELLVELHALCEEQPGGPEATIFRPSHYPSRPHGRSHYLKLEIWTSHESGILIEPHSTVCHSVSLLRVVWHLNPRAVDLMMMPERMARLDYLGRTSHPVLRRPGLIAWPLQRD